MKYVIVGGPRTGKTTLANRLSAKLGIPVKHTDDLIGSHEWSESSAQVAQWMREDGDCIIEGVATVRALRKLEAAQLYAANMKIIRLTDTMVFTTIRQQAMHKGVETVWDEIHHWLRSRGVMVLNRSEAEALCD